MNPHYVSFLALLIVIWTVPWKAYAVWLAVKHNHKKWFIALLILNTIGILELVYIFRVLKKSWVDVKKDFHKAWVLIRK